MKKSSFRLIVTCLALVLLLTGSVPLLRQAERRFWEASYPLAYQDEVEAAAVKYNLPPSLIFAVIHTESHFNPDAVSAADAKGLMQLTDETYRWALQRQQNEKSYNPLQLFEPSANIDYGVYVLSLLTERFTYTDVVLAAYNAGQGRVAEWLADPNYSEDGQTLDVIPFTETDEYVRRVNKARKQYQILYNLD